MKGGFWAGVVSAVIAGVVLFALEQAYSDWRAANSDSVSVRINNDAAVLSQSDVKAIEAALQGDSAVRIASITATNTGSDAVVNDTIHFSSEIDTSPAIYASGIVPSGGADADTLVVQKQASGFDVTFKSLPADKQQTFWIAYRCCQIFSASPMTPGLSLTQSISDYDRDDSWWPWFTYIISCLVALIAGLVLDSSVTSRMLRNRGYNLQDILRRPVTPPPE